VRLTTERLSFEPNAVNVAIHENGSELRFDLPLELIDGLAYRKAVLTNIVEVMVAGGRVSFRCFGARDFLKLIEETRAAKIAALN
jgi:methylmalonyl-CoA mutase N-terminal domain/subunit